MTDDRLVRARAVLDERERLATAASGLAGPAWKVLRDGVYEPGNLYAGWIIREGSCTTRAEAAHIAASDPATILREVAGWRAALDLHMPNEAVREYWDPASRCCAHDGLLWPCPTAEVVLTTLGVTP